MMPSKSYQRLLLYLLLALLLTSLLSPWVAALWESMRSTIPGWKDYRYPFSRIFNRLFVILAIALFIPCRRLLKIGSLRQLGLQPVRSGYPDLLTGLFLSLASVMALGIIMALSAVFTPYFRLPLDVGLRRIIKAVLTASAVGFLEEIFFRGLVFKGLLEDWKPAGAFVGASLFYSALHFIRPAEKFPLEGLDPWAGLVYLLHTFERFLDPVSLLPGLLGLFLLGLVLSYAFYRTGSLYFSIGLHAGWVFGIKTIRIFGDYHRQDLGWVFGSYDPKFISGFATWICVIVVGLVLHPMTRGRTTLSISGPSSDPPLSKEA